MRTIKQWYQDLNLQSKFTLVLLVIVAIPAIAIIFFFYGNAYDMVVSYTIRQEQDRSAQTAPLIEESLQKILDVSTEISSLDFYQTLFKNAITDSFSDLAESEDAADFSDRIRQLTQDTPVTNVKIYMEVPKEASADVDAFLNSDHLKDTFPWNRPREPTGTEFSEEPGQPSCSALPFILVHRKRKHTETRPTLPMLP